MKPVWVVEVSYDDGEVDVCGPYTETQASHVMAKVRAEVEMATDNDGAGHHPRGVRWAAHYPLRRYDGFLTTAERRNVRLRAALKAWAALPEHRRKP